jgi:hypothetical protein
MTSTQVLIKTWLAFHFHRRRWTAAPPFRIIHYYLEHGSIEARSTQHRQKCWTTFTEVRFILAPRTWLRWPMKLVFRIKQWKHGLLNASSSHEHYLVHIVAPQVSQSETAGEGERKSRHNRNQQYDGYPISGIDPASFLWLDMRMLLEQI